MRPNDIHGGALDAIKSRPQNRPACQELVLVDVMVTSWPSRVLSMARGIMDWGDMCGVAMDVRSGHGEVYQCRSPVSTGQRRDRGPLLDNPPTRPSIPSQRHPPLAHTVPRPSPPLSPHPPASGSLAARTGPLVGPHPCTNQPRSAAAHPFPPAELSDPKPPCCPPNQSQYLRDGICKVLSLHAALRSLCHGLAAVSRRKMEVGDMPMRGRCSLSGHAHASTAVPVLYRRWDVGAHMHTYTTWWALLCRTGGPTYIHACRQSQRFHGASPLVFPLTLPV